MKVFLTGATGFVGGYLLSRLVADGHAVRAMARADGDLDALKAKGAEPIKADLLDEKSLERCVGGMEIVVHCGGLSSATEQEEELFFRANTLGSFLLLEKARLAGVKQFVFISSILVYLGLEKPLYLPVDERHPLFPHKNQAGAYKVAIEAYCYYYHIRYGMNTSAFRLAGVFGEIRKKQYGWPERIDNARQGKDFVCSRNSGSMTVSARDVAGVISLAIGNENIGGEVFNLADFYLENAYGARRIAEIGKFNYKTIEKESKVQPYIISNEKVRRVFGFEFSGKQHLDEYLKYLIDSSSACKTQQDKGK
ncbi:MAG: NAD(P)-dependent oxidoreductase [Kiritimatiellaeota bacterium]|nr:NAD(P)-dependent oxidoreductase [Kiritimatiellota bacterium]